jgi:gluconate 2-dehydrogenase subunit 3-like protein
MEPENSSRRDFLKTVGMATASVAVSGSAMAFPAAPTADRKGIVAALGDTLIPSDPGDPGYKDLESHGITGEVLKALPGVSDNDSRLFNEKSKDKFADKTFLELSEAQRGEYLRQILDGSAASDAKELETLRRVFRNTRRRVLSVYYSNFPENTWPRDKSGAPMLKPGDLHQITNPNTKELVTGWDQTGFFGPLTWEEEERRRNWMKKIHWHEGWSPMDYQPEKPKKA